MKKLLGLLGAMGLVATTSATVVSCGNKEDNKKQTPADKLITDIEAALKKLNNETKDTAREKIDTTLKGFIKGDVKGKDVAKPTKEAELKLDWTVTVDEAKKSATTEIKVFSATKKDNDYIWVATPKTKNVEIKLVENKLNEIKIDKADINVTMGEPQRELVIQEAGDKNFAATSNKTDVVEASYVKTGTKVVLTFKAVGNAQVTVKCDGYADAIINVTVNAKQADKDFTFDKDVKSLSVKVGAKIDFTITNTDALGDLAVTSSDATVATVAKDAANAKKIVVTGVKAGSAKVKLTAKGFKTVEVNVTVTAAQ